MGTASTSIQQLFRCTLWSSKRSVLIVILLCFVVLISFAKFVTIDGMVARYGTDHAAIHRVSSVRNKTAPKILVAFTGPSEAKDAKNGQLYMRNTDHFLKYGVQCHDRNTIITVGEEYYDDYYPKVKAIRDSQCSNGHFVHLISRRSFCYDMETVRLIVRGAVAGVNWREYDYFVYLNCGVTGPHPQFQYTWLEIYLSRLKAPVHMTGLSLNCDPETGPHIQSMAFAVDRVGMDLIQSVPYDCTTDGNGNIVELEVGYYWELIHKYEIAMSREILKNGYAIAAATLYPGLVLSNNTFCNLTDIWYPEELKKQHGGRLPSWKETIFWKSSRFMTEEIQKVIGYEGKTDLTVQ